jgi:hypothetical protein
MHQARHEQHGGAAIESGRKTAAREVNGLFGRSIGPGGRIVLQRRIDEANNPSIMPRAFQPLS